MKSVAMGLALAALIGLTPAVAKDKRAEMGASGDKQATADVGRGGLKEWPVSKEEADWSGAAASSSTGVSSGASGSDSGTADQK
jgi:hypothetical protein